MHICVTEANGFHVMHHVTQMKVRVYSLKFKPSSFLVLRTRTHSNRCTQLFGNANINFVTQQVFEFVTFWFIHSVK